MIDTGVFISQFPKYFAGKTNLPPWEITSNLDAILSERIKQLGNEYAINEGVAIHQTAQVEQGAVLKAPVIISEHCFIGANAYLRGGVYVGNLVRVGTGCEIKTSLVFNDSSIAHFNFIGDSIIGSHVNFEAGAITSNHYNEREHKLISVIYNGTILQTGITKFGALVGDHSKIGANAVLSPGTILLPHSIVKRLELVDQSLRQQGLQ